MTLEQALLAGFGGLTAAVVYLFGWFRQQFKVVEGKLARCEEDREELWERIAGITNDPGDTPTARGIRPHKPKPTMNLKALMLAFVVLGMTALLTSCLRGRQAEHPGILYRDSPGNPVLFPPDSE